MHTANGFAEAPLHSLDDERGLLGSVIIDPGRIDEVRAIVTRGDFHSPAHRAMLDIVCELHGETGNVDPVMLGTRWKGNSASAGAEGLLHDLFEAVPISSNAAHFAKTVRELSLRRKAVALGESLIAKARRGDAIIDIATLAHAEGQGLADDLDGVQDSALSGPIMRRLCDIEPERVEWLWPNRIPLGKLTTLNGNPGGGKTFFTSYLAAAITTGSELPDAAFSNFPQGSAIFLNCEDDAADTLRPRFDAHGGDASKVLMLDAVRDRASGKDRQFDISQDIPALETAAKQLGDLRLVVIDPITAYMGEVDSHKNAEVRWALAPLVAFAAKHRVAVVGINHLNKSNGGAMYRAMGSLAFIAVPRAAWCIAADKDDPKRRLLLPIKTNLSIDPTGLAFEITNGVVCFDPNPVSTTVDDALAVDPHGKGPDATERDEASDFLRSTLAAGPRFARDLVEEAREAHGISKRTLDRAKKEVGVISFRSSGSGPWEWKLPAERHIASREHD